MLNLSIAFCHRLLTTNMRPSTILQYWILIVLVPLLSLAAPINLQNIIYPGKIVKVPPRYFVGIGQYLVNKHLVSAVYPCGI